MAVLRELGNKFPVSTQGSLIDLEDETAQIGPGDIVEAWYEADRDIDAINVAPALEEILKMKEEYPDFVLHYIRIETRRVYVQFSAAPPVQAISRSGISSSVSAIITWGTVLIILAIATIIAGFLAVVLKMVRGYVMVAPRPVGDAVVVAKDLVTGLLLAKVRISTDGRSGLTGASGEGVLFDNLLAGTHTFVGSGVEGYDTPAPVSATVQEDKVVNVTIAYNPTGHIPPTHGWLTIDTDPVKGKVFIDGQDKGVAPITAYLNVGDHIISFGFVENWITPEQQIVTIHGEPIEDSTIGYYTQPEAPWWQTLVKGVAIGLAGTAAAAILIPRISKAVREKGGA